MREGGTFRTLKVLIAFRILFVSVLLGAFFALRLEYGFFPHPRVVLFLITCIYALNIVYLLLIRFPVLSQKTQGYVQLSLDVVIVVSLIMATGGIESWFSSTLLLVIIASSIVIDRKAAYILATAAGILYGTFIDLQYYRILPVAFGTNLTEKNFLFNIVLNLAALYLTAYLIGYLTHGLERTKIRLDEKISDLDQLAHFHQDVLENIPSGLFSSDLNGRIRLFNKAAEMIMEIPREKVIGLQIQELFPFLGDVITPRRLSGVIDHRGRRKYIGMNLSAHRDSQGNEVGFLGTFQDLTEIVRLENEVKRREKFAAIGELSANIAHEIRNPLASIKGSIEMIKEGTLKDSDRIRLMDIAVREMTRLNNIITEFLSYSNPKPPAFQEHDVAGLLSNAIALFRASLKDRPGIHFKENVSADLVADVDGEKINQVVWNLLQNAVQAIGGDGMITLRAWREHGDVLIEIQDSGIGIDQEDRERIFFPFYSTKKGGTGLGLAISYRIIEEHHGSIQVESEAGKGSIFRVSLPGKRSKLLQGVG